MSKAEEKIDKDAGLDDEYIIVKEVTKIDDGVHKGHIANLTRETRKGFEYVDIYIDLDDQENDVTIKTGFPCNVSEVSGFGKLITKAGLEFEAGDQISFKDIKKRLIGRDIKFQTFTDENGFSNVMNKTLKFVN